MNILLTKEQYEELKSDGYAFVKYEPEKLELYFQVDSETGLIQYVEANTHEDCIAFDAEDYARHIEYKEKHKMSEKNNECPHCFTPMIYKFNYCPKCGQILEWEGEDEDE